LPTLQRAILSALKHGPLNQYELADELGEAPFRIRGELQAMRRDRLVTDRLEANARTWRLTDAGYEIAWAQAQPEMFR
jgi:DNA-binding PadR family transcriptional regulator